MMHAPLLSRAIACLLLVCLPLQAMAIASVRALGPAHVHLAMDADVDDDHGHALGEDDDHDHDHHGHHHPHPHHHHDDGAIGHHTHDPRLPGIVYLDDDDHGAASTDAATRLAGKRWLIDQESLAPTLVARSCGSQRPPAPPAATPRFRSQVVAPLERPPR